MLWIVIAALTVLGLLGIGPASPYLGDIAFGCLLGAIVLATVQALRGHRGA